MSWTSVSFKSAAFVSTNEMEPPNAVARFTGTQADWPDSSASAFKVAGKKKHAVDSYRAGQAAHNTLKTSKYFDS
jgi:hypothetical protein